MATAKQKKNKPLKPRQEAFLANYVDPTSETFSNAMQSALRAGYGQEYAESLTSQAPNWLTENLGRMIKLKKAERNLDEYLDMEPGENVGLERIKFDATKFTLETVGKKVYSKRTDDDKDINVQINLVRIG